MILNAQATNSGDARCVLYAVERHVATATSVQGPGVALRSGKISSVQFRLLSAQLEAAISFLGASRAPCFLS